MMTISYEYENGLYLNLTNRCNCSCAFCLRHNGHKGSIYADDLWLEHEPSREEIWEDLAKRNLSSYREIVFCGFGEPTYRWEDDKWLIDRLKRIYADLPPFRINTNGHGNQINGYDITPEFAGRLDTVSVSLNASSRKEYVRLTAPSSGEKGFDDMLLFTKKSVQFVPKVVMTVVDKGKDAAEIDACRKLAASVGATLRVRAYIPD